MENLRYNFIIDDHDDHPQMARGGGEHTSSIRLRLDQSTSDIIAAQSFDNMSRYTVNSALTMPA